MSFTQPYVVHIFFQDLSTKALSKETALHYYKCISKKNLYLKFTQGIFRQKSLTENQQYIKTVRTLDFRVKLKKVGDHKPFHVPWEVGERDEV